MKECSFTPTANVSKNIRKIDEFLEDQQKFLKKKQEKITRMIEEKKAIEEAKTQAPPKLSEKTKVLALKREEKKNVTGKAVYERLYSNRQIAKQEKKVE